MQATHPNARQDRLHEEDVPVAEEKLGFTDCQQCRHQRNVGLGGKHRTNEN